MRLLIASSAIALAVAAPSVGAAQELKFSAGASVVSKVVMDGVGLSRGAGFQPWVEAEFGGFYGGLWASNLTPALAGAKSEVDVYFGYRGEINALSYDIGYAHYFMQSPSADSGEVFVALGHDLTEQLSLGARLGYNHVSKGTKATISLGYAVTDKFALDATYGRINKGGHSWLSLGGSYAINDNLAIGVAYHDSSIAKSVGVVSLDYSFSFR